MEYLRYTVLKNLIHLFYDAHNYPLSISLTNLSEPVELKSDHLQTINPLQPLLSP